MSKINQAFATGKEMLCRRVFTTKNLRIVKLTAFFLLTGLCLHAGMGGHSQTVTISVRNEPLDKVFSEIQKQTGYGFIYRAELLQATKNVNLQVKQASLKEVLELCFKDQPLVYNINSIERAIVVSKKENNENISPPPPVPPLDVRGKLTNDKGEPIAGASIKVKGSDKGTSTNENGEFTVNDIDANAVLVISATNIETLEIKVNGKAELGTVTVKNKITEGEQVIIRTGYDNTPKDRYVGSVVQLDSAAYHRRAGMDIISRLDGAVNSVLFDKKQGARNRYDNIKIRGISTLENQKSPIGAPLIVVDNFPFKQDLNTINPNDIESITVLRDAAAASIWGAQAGNGVIVITTKKGKYNQPLHVSVSSNITIQEKPDQYYYPQMSISDFVDAELFLFSKGKYDADLANISSWPAISPVVEMLARRRAGKISVTDSVTQIDAFKELDLRHDLDKYVYRPAISQQHYINLGGGSNLFNYNFSAGYNHDLNNIQNSKPNDQFSFTSNIGFHPVKNLEVATGISYSQGTQRSADFSLPVKIYPYAQLADAEGRPLAVPNGRRVTYLDTAGGGKLLDWRYRPLEEPGLTGRTSVTRFILMNIGISYRFSNWLNGKLSYQYNNQSLDNNNYHSPETYLTRDLVNQFTNLSQTLPDLRNPVPIGGILDVGHGESISQNARAQLSLNKNLGNKHLVTGLIATEISETKGSGDGNRFYGYNKENGTYKSSIDYVTPFPMYGGLSSNKQIPRVGYIPSNNSRFVSFLGNVSYIYEGRYALYASARKDGSNAFGVNTNRKWKPLWSAGASWDISKEGFYSVKWASYLRLRASYGCTGNPGNATGLPTIAYSPGSAGLTNLIIAFPGDAPNPDLRWEKVRIINTALDFSLFRDRLSGSIEIWQKKSTDVISSTGFAPSTGITTFTVNVANLKGNGFDIRLNSKNINGIFQWQSSFGLSHTKTIVTKLYDNPYRAIDFVNYSLNAAEGKMAYGIASFRWAGLDPLTGDPRGYLNKQVSTSYTAIFNDSINNQTFHGSAIPLYFGYIGNSFSWKKFTLSANITYRLNFYFRKPTIGYANLANGWNGHADYTLRWQKPGDEKFTNVPSFTYPVNSDRDLFYQFSEINVLRGDNVRLQDIRLQYTWDNMHSKKLPFKNLGVFVYANNLNLILWRKNKSGLDPDFTGGASFTAPASKTWTGGVNLNF